MPRHRKLALAIAAAVSLTALRTHAEPRPDLPAPVPLLEAEADQRLYLSVTVNGNAIGGLYQFTQTPEGLFATSTTLESLGFRQQPEWANGDLIPLSSVATVVFDTPKQTLNLMAPLSRLLLETTRLSNIDEHSTPRADPLLRATQLNYTLSANRTDERVQAGGVYRLLQFGLGQGVLETSGLADWSEGGSGGHTRLDTQWRRDWGDRALRLEVGDVLTGGTNDWARQIRLGGVRIGTQYKILQPNRLLSALPEFRGSAVVPSSLEVYIRGVKSYAAQVPAGPFDLRNAPGITGSGQATVVVTDATGARQNLIIPFFYAPQLLEPGLMDWSATAGVLRQDYGNSSWSYGDTPAASAGIRRGMTRWLTLEGSAEASSDLRNVGLGANLLVGTWGYVQLAAAGSSYQGRNGTKWSAEYQWNNARFSFSARQAQTQADYCDLGCLESNTRNAQKARTVALGLNLGRYGSVAGNYSELTTQQDRTKLFGVNWNFSPFRGSMLNLGYSTDPADFKHGMATLSFNLQMAKHPGRSVGVSVRSAPEAPVSWSTGVQQNINGEFGRGWQAELGSSAGRVSLGLGSDWRHHYGQLISDLQLQGDKIRLASTATGTVLFAAGEWALRPTVYDSFALVKTGVPGLGVRVENRYMGKTNARGQLLVGGLNAWRANRVSIDTLDLPANFLIEQTKLNLVPQAGAGALATFRVRNSQPATLRLVDDHAAALTMGSTLQWQHDPNAETGDDEGPFSIGYDGEVFVPNLAPGTHVGRVQGEHGTCTITVTVEPRTNPGDILRIDPVSCRPQLSEPKP